MRCRHVAALLLLALSLLAGCRQGIDELAPEPRLDLRPLPLPVLGKVSFTFDVPWYDYGGEAVADHCLVYDEGEGLYHLFHTLWYGGIQWDGDCHALGHATSPDLRDWTRRQEIPLGSRNGLDWDRWGIWAPQVIPNPMLHVPARWAMFYTGVPEWGGPQAIGLAFSDDLFTWTKSAANPVYSTEGADWATYDPATPDNAPCRDAHVFFVGQQLYMVMTCEDEDAPDGPAGVIGLARAATVLGLYPDLEHWTHMPEPVLVKDSWVHPESPLIVRAGSDIAFDWWHLFYSDGDTRQQAAADFRGPGGAGWSGLTHFGHVFPPYGYTAGEVNYLAGEHVLSRHDGPDHFRFTFLDFESLNPGAAGPYPEHFDCFSPGRGVEGLVGLRGGLADRSLRWWIGDQYGDEGAFWYQPTWGDNPLHDPARGISSRMTGNAYVATYERCYQPLGEGSWGPGGHWPDFTRTGWIRSDDFMLTGNSMSLWVGGGDYPEDEFVALVDAGDHSVLFSETGNGTHVMTRRVWNTGRYLGRTVYLLMVDQATGDMGCISCDAIVEFHTGGHSHDVYLPEEQDRGGPDVRDLLVP